MIALSIDQFLAARLDERERVARAAQAEHPTPWIVENDGCRIESPDGSVVVYDEGSPGPGAAEHIAYWDPARVLAEVAAKRAMLRRAQAEGQIWVIVGLVQPYAEHPDFDQAWKVGP